MVLNQAEHGISIHADDLGINNEITDNIIHCIDQGMVTSTSLVCNTEGFDYARKRYQTMENAFDLRLHINLVEGVPLTPKEEIPMLINRKGEFRHSFLTLWLKYIFSPRKKKTEFKNQVRMEVLKQIGKFREAVGSDVKIGLDSHTHIHMIPFILNLILALSNSESINFIRLPKEKFYYSRKNIGNYFSLNLIKNVLLYSLCSAQQKKVTKEKIQTNTCFIGVMATGRMTVSSVHAALKRIKLNGKYYNIEILFHPGGVRNENTINWTHHKGFRAYYLSENRKKEADVLTGKSLKQLIKAIINHESISDYR